MLQDRQCLGGIHHHQEENEEVSALYGGSRHVLSQEFENWYVPNGIFGPWKGGRQIKDFQAAALTVKQTQICGCWTEA